MAMNFAQFIELINIRWGNACCSLKAEILFNKITNTYADFVCSPVLFHYTVHIRNEYLHLLQFSTVRKLTVPQKIIKPHSLQKPSGS